MSVIINVDKLNKDFKIPKKPKDEKILTKLKGIFYREWEDKRILEDVSFTVKEGEIIGYVGPNGAGKSTTIKALTGVISPTKGNVSVLGFNPVKDRYKYTYNIGVVFGNRSLLEFDIAVIESLKLYKDIYELSQEVFDERVEYFSKILDLGELLNMLVRKLSLGQRMRCEIAASLLHKPKIVFLDEPTIGLDAIAKEEIREFLKEINKTERTTIILTTYDMDDIEELCNRIIILDEGKIIYDGDLSTVKKNYIKYKRIEFEFSKVKDKTLVTKLKKNVEVVSESKSSMVVRAEVKKDVAKIIDNILKSFNVIDLTISEPRLENVIKEIYKSGEVNGSK